jgi:DNA repair protein RadD
MTPNYASAKFPEPRPFQASAREKLRAGFVAGHRCQIVMSPTGSGKTILAMFLIQECLMRGKRVIFVADRRTLINQTSEVADSLGLISHGVLMASHWRYNVHLPFQIASAQTLARRSWPDADLIIIDECFPAGTMVETPDGEIAIELLSNGDFIYNCFGLTRIESVYNKVSNNIIKIRLSNGTSIECTDDHPIFTDMGWQPAGSMVVGTRLFCKEAVRELRENDCSGYEDANSSGQRDQVLPNRGAVFSSEVLLNILRSEIKEKTSEKGNIHKTRGVESLLGENEAEKSNAIKRNTRQDDCNSQADRAWAKGAWRERPRNDYLSNSNDGGAWAGMGGGICGKDTKEQQRGLSAPLQNRHRESTIESCRGTGWAQSFFGQKEGSRQEKGRAFEVIRVESIEAFESGRGATVYNLRVAGHPSYFANGILVHNCHTKLKAWTDHIQTCRAAVIGLSATPFSNGLGKLFTNLVNATTMRELTESGVLVPMRVMSCTKVNMKGAATAGGEWTDKAAEERGMDIVGDVVHEWIKHAEGRKTIVFGSTIAHCEGMVREFNSAGIMATAFTADTTEAERKEILDDFKKPDSILRVLISVEALAKGFDQKDVSCVCDVRPLRKSLSTAIQMWGRGLRSSPETGKTDLLLLDFSGNIVRFSEDFEAIYHDGLDALDMGEKLDKTIRKDDEEESDAPAKCPKCQFMPFRKRCMSCGFEIIKPNFIEHEAGEMVEFKVGKATVGDKLAVWEQAVTLCRGQGNAASAKGRAAHLYKSITGVFPRNLPDFDAVPNVVISRAVLNKAKANAIAYRARAA